jgi:glyoxylase-like metal-dependent hydrolase (beta-lactamase superfamily II)
MQLTERVYLVGSGKAGFNSSNPYDCHVYLLDGGAELALVDCGAGLDLPAILGNTRAAGFDPRRIRHLVLTHKHSDHAGGAAELQAAFGVQTYATQHTAQVVSTADEKRLGLPMARRGGVYPPDYRFRAAEVHNVIKDGDRVMVGDLDLLVVETPGHCDGHCSFAFTHEDITHLFAGDAVLFGGQIILQDIPDCSVSSHMRSIERLAELKPDVFLPGHLQIILRDGWSPIEAAMARIRLGLSPVMGA